MNAAKNVRVSMPAIRLQSVCMLIVGNRLDRRVKGKGDVGVLNNAMLTELGEPILMESGTPIIKE